MVGSVQKVAMAHVFHFHLCFQGDRLLLSVSDPAASVPCLAPRAGPLKESWIDQLNGFLGLFLV